MFGFIGEGELSEVFERREAGFLTFFEEVIGKILVIFGDSGGNGGVVWLISLDKSVGLCEMATANPAENLGEEVESALLCGEIREGKARIGLDHANGGEIWKV